jgi:hypothetical protein
VPVTLHSVNVLSLSDTGVRAVPDSRSTEALLP